MGGYKLVLREHEVHDFYLPVSVFTYLLLSALKRLVVRGLKRYTDEKQSKPLRTLSVRCSLSLNIMFITKGTIKQMNLCANSGLISTRDQLQSMTI